MKITDFKKGDLIHRLKPSIEIGDRSFIESPIIFLKIKSGLIFYEWTDHFKGRRGVLNLVDYNDNEWDYYPDVKFSELSLHLQIAWRLILQKIRLIFTTEIKIK